MVVCYSEHPVLFTIVFLLSYSLMSQRPVQPPLFSLSSNLAHQLTSDQLVLPQSSLVKSDSMGLWSIRLTNAANKHTGCSTRSVLSLSLCHIMNPPSAERESANWARKTCREKGSSQVIPRHFLSVLPLKAHCPSPLTLSHAKPGDCKMDSMPLSQNSKLVLIFGLSHVSKWTSWLKTMCSWCFACCYIVNKRSGKGRLIWSECNKMVYGTRWP